MFSTISDMNIENDFGVDLDNSKIAEQLQGFEGNGLDIDSTSMEIAEFSTLEDEAPSAVKEAIDTPMSSPVTEKIYANIGNKEYLKSLARGEDALGIYMIDPKDRQEYRNLVCQAPIASLVPFLSLKGFDFGDPDEAGELNVELTIESAKVVQEAAASVDWNNETIEAFPVEHTLVQEAKKLLMDTVLELAKTLTAQSDSGSVVDEDADFNPNQSEFEAATDFDIDYDKFPHLEQDPFMQEEVGLTNAREAIKAAEKSKKEKSVNLFSLTKELKDERTSEDKAEFMKKHDITEGQYQDILEIDSNKISMSDPDGIQSTCNRDMQDALGFDPYQ